ncbi:hypothetical protein Tco_1252282 [Tanacetum coccineum]
MLVGSGSTNTGGTDVPEMHGFSSIRPYEWASSLIQGMKKIDKVKWVAMSRVEGRALNLWKKCSDFGTSNANQKPLEPREKL